MSAYSSNIVAFKVINRACEITGWSPPEIIGPSRIKELAEVRFACMAAMRQRGIPVTQIGRKLGWRDHSGVRHGLKRAEQLRAFPEFEALVEDLERA